MSIGIASEGSESVEVTSSTERRFTESIYSSIEEVFSKAGTGKPELSAVAVCIGPGSFTGVRVGVGSAKGLAHSLGIPVIGVSSFEVCFFNRNAEKICGVVPYKKDKVSYMLNSSDDLMTEGLPGTWEDLNDIAKSVDLITGYFSLEQVSGLKVITGEACEIVTIDPSGGRIAEIGLVKFQKELYNAGVEGITELSPLYAHTMQFRERVQKFGTDG